MVVIEAGWSESPQATKSSTELSQREVMHGFMKLGDASSWANKSDGKHFCRFASTFMGDKSAGKVRRWRLHAVVLPANGGIGQVKWRITGFISPSWQGFFTSGCAGRCQMRGVVLNFRSLSSCAVFLAGFDLLRRLGARRSVPGSRGRWRGSCIAGRMMGRSCSGTLGGWASGVFRSSI